MATDARLSQLIAEILRTGTAVPAELSQVALELVRAHGTETPLPPTVSPQPHVQVMT